MSRLFVALMASLLASWAPPAHAQAVTEPRPVTTVEPAYPDAARAHGIDGEAAFIVAVNPDGTVDRVRVVAVPRQGLGFEAAIEQAVRQWTFEPATFDGKPVIGTYAGRLRFALPTVLAGEVMYPAQSREVWKTVQTVMRQFGFSDERRDDRHQVFVTRPRPYNVTGLPSAGALGLTAERPITFQLHVYVAPSLEPARVAVGAVVGAEPMVSVEPRTRQLATTVFSPPALTEWFVGKLSAALGRPPEPMATAVVARAEQARRLMPSGVTDHCVVDLPTAKVDAAFTPPQKVYDFHPPYPGRAVFDAQEAEVLLTAELTEHGTIVRPSPLRGSGEFQVAARQAAMLWRFEPARHAGCGIPAQMTIAVQFKMP